MLNEKELKETLLTLTRVMKSQTDVYATLAIELSAVKNTLRDLDLSPPFEETLTAKRLEAHQSISPTVLGLIDTLDHLIQKLTSGQV